MRTWSCITIVGVGLIGGSVGLAARARGVARKVIGTGSRATTLAEARRLGAITEIATDPAAAVADAELVVICAPVDRIVEQARAIAGLCRPGTLITDAGSTKAQIVAQLEQAATEPGWGRDVRFVGSHPLAGNEKRGPQHASDELFAGRTVVITPGDQSPAGDIAAIAEFWTSLGAKTVQMSPEEHDRALAATSHLPHLVAAALAAVTPQRYLALTAGGWQDSTRIAAGDPDLWRQILLSNRANLLESLDRLISQLAKWRETIDCADAHAAQRLLSEAKRLRDAAGS
jgi:prephenate dehydrogenase